MKPVEEKSIIILVIAIVTFTLFFGLKALSDLNSEHKQRTQVIKDVLNNKTKGLLND